MIKFKWKKSKKKPLPMTLEAAFTTITEKTCQKFSIKKYGLDFYEVSISSGIEFKIEDQQEFVDAQKQMGGHILPVLIICGEHASTNIDVLNYVSKKENDPYSKADAFVIQSVAQRILGNFYLNIVKPQRPTKLFSKREEAFNWLKQYIEEA